MHRRVGVTALVAASSVLLSAAGHVVVAGHGLPAGVLPQLAALTALCLLLGLSGLKLYWLLPALGAVQVGLHMVLMEPAPAAPAVAHHAHHHGTPLPPATESAGPGLAMVAMHVAALVFSAVLLHRTQHWWRRLCAAAQRVLPALPALVPPVPVRPVALLVSARPAPVPERWIPGDVRRRGPPAGLRHH